MRDFRKGDEVDFMFDQSIQKFYGVVRVVRQKSCTVEVIDNFTGKVEVMAVPKRILNWR